MLRDIALIHLAVRILVFAFFLALSIGKSAKDQALIVVPASVYLTFSIYNFLYPGRLKIFKNYGDLVFLPTLVFLSRESIALLALFPFLALYTSRKVLEGMLFLWLSVGLSIYYYGKTSLILLPLILSTYIASLHPDLIEALRKERFYIRNLRRNYSKLMEEYSRLEKELSDLKLPSLLLEKLQSSKTLEDYLKSIKEEFNLKAIKITPSNNYSAKAKKDIDSCSFQLPVNLEKGQAIVIFYLNNPLELYDEGLLKGLEMAGNLINLYIEGFEEKAKYKEVAL